MVGVGDKLDDAVKAAATAYNRLVLVVGVLGSGKTQALRSLAAARPFPFINVNLAISQRMLELTKGQRARQADRLFDDLIQQAASDVVVLDNLEILFDATLQVDPLRMLQLASRNRLIVASWNGTYENGTLSYAEPHHPEYRSYRDVAAVIVTASAAGSAVPSGS
jgi:hypothetical protein